MNKFTKAARAIVSDPAFGFNFGGVLLFASSGLVSLIATAAATLGVMAVKALPTLAPVLMQKDNRFTKALKDPRTPLLLATAAMAVVTVAGAMAGASGLTIAAAAIFTIGDYLLAEQTGRAVKSRSQAPQAKSENKKLPLAQVLKQGLKLPEPYLAAGLMVAALTTGGLSTIAFPFIMMGAGVCVANTLKGDPEWKGHPKVFYTIGMTIFGAVGLCGGNWPAILTGLSNLVSGSYMTKLEGDLTPGGFGQVWNDVKQALKNLLPTKKTSPQLPEFSIEIASRRFTPPPLAPGFKVAVIPSLKADISAPAPAVLASTLDNR